MLLLALRTAHPGVLQHLEFIVLADYERGKDVQQLGLASYDPARIE
jgi:hypothetical protein